MWAADLVQVPSWGAWALRQAVWGTPASTAPLYPDKGLVLLHQHDVTIHRPGRVLAALTAMLALVAVMLPIAPAVAHDHADTTGTYTVTVSHDISGDRIQGADVHIESTVDGQPYDEGTVTTDGDGRAEFDGISLDGSLDITVTGDGFLDRNVEIPAAAVVDGGGYSATITPEGHHLHGGVYDADTSDTIAGATVSIDDQGESVTSDADGDYHLADLDSGTYTVTADADGYAPYSAEVDIANATLYPINLEPTDDDLGEIVGTITDADTDDPIESAEVTVSSPTGGDTTTTSAADGTYQVGGLETATTYDVTVDADGYESANQNVPVEDTNTVTADFELDAEEPATGGVTVSVYGDMALPLYGVDVELVDDGDTVVGTYSTGSTHTVTISDLDVGDYTVNIDHDGYAPFTTTTTVTSDETANVTAILEREPGDIAGELIDLADGSLVERNANIDLIDSLAIEVDSVFTDDGEFAFDDVEPGTYTLEVSAFGYEDASLTTVHVTSGETTDVTVELDGIPATLTVNVNDDATGDRLPSATATLNGDDLTPTDDGEFLVDDLDPGAYTLEVDADGYTAEQRDFDLDWGDVRLEGFSLEVEGDPVDGEIDGMVIDADTSDPIEGAEVTDTGSGDTFVTAADGSFGGPAEPGDYTVTVTAVGYQDLDADLTVTAGETTDVTFELRPEASEPDTGAVVGRVTDTDGSPVAGAEVTIDGKTTTTGDDGTFELDGVDVGTHEVVVTVDGYTHGHAHVDVTAGDTTTMDDVVLAAVDVALSCNVHGAGAAPGDHVECAISGLPAGQDVSVAVTLNPTLLDGESVADDDGNVEFAFDVPDDATGDDEIFIAVEVADAEADATFTLDIVEDEQLPRTGLDLLVLVLMAAATLTAGGTALRVTSRT